MHREEYINRLVERLKQYDIKNLYEIMADYEQIIDEILIDNNDDFNMVIEKLGYPEILADEIVGEFGFEAIGPKNKNTSTKNNRLETRRQKSNIVWNILLSIYYVFQAFAILVVVAVIAITAYIGPNKSVSFKPINNNHEYYIQASVCENNKCEKYQLYGFSDTDDDFFDNSFFDDDDDHSGYNWFTTCTQTNKTCVTPTFHSGIVAGIIITGVLFTQVILYLLVQRNIKAIIASNNEYNRRRNYE